MLLPVNFKGQIKVTKAIKKLQNGGRRNRVWMVNNQHIFKKKLIMDNRVLNIHHRRMDLRAFVKESLRGHQERRLSCTKDHKKKMLERELAHLEQGGDAEVEDQYVLSCFQLRDLLLLRQKEWDQWDPSMKPQPNIKLIGSINDAAEESHICKILQDEDTWFGHNFGCDYAKMMESHFIIKKDLPTPYYQQTERGMKQTEPFYFKDEASPGIGNK